MGVLLHRCHFISNEKEKKWISNVILLGFFVFSCVFVFLLDDKLVRNEVENNAKLNAGNENEDKKQTVSIEIKNN